MRPLAKPPFYAAEVRLAHVALTAVGLRIDSQSRVLSDGGQPIPGLVSAVEVVGGVVGDVYVGSGNSITSAFVFGKVAGESAALKRRQRVVNNDATRNE